MTTIMMWKSLDLFFVLTIKTMPYYVDCSKRHARIIPERIIPWWIFVISVFVQLSSELVFLLKILFDKNFYESAEAFEILLSTLYFTCMSFYLVLFLTGLNYYNDLVQLFNGFMLLEQRFLGKSALLLQH